MVKANGDEEWALIQRNYLGERVPAFLRVRTPVIAPSDVGDNVHLLQVLWAFGDAGTDAIATDDDRAAMETFEFRLCDAWEHDGTAYLAAVLTYDGARQWVYYVTDIDECSRRLHDMPQEAEPYPIELTTRPDPTWSFLHDELLGSMSPADHAALYGRPRARRAGARSKRTRPKSR